MTGRSAAMGRSHGRTAPQNPRGLRKLPRGHPRQETRPSTHGVVTGERRAVTSRMRRSDWGPWEKDLLSRHLADGPPVPSGRASPAASRTSPPPTAAACPQHCPRPVRPIGKTAENTAADTRAGRHARRLFETVHALTRTGRSHSSVARELNLDRRTVRKYAQARTWQEVMRRPPRKPSTLDPYLDYLQQRWDEGQHSAKILHEELQGKGYLGHYQRVRMAVAPLRRGLPLDEPSARPPSPREAARWITARPGRRSPHINDRLPRLIDHCPELRHTHDLVLRFAAMLDNRDATSLPRWLNDLTERTGPSHRPRRSPARRPACRRPGHRHPLQLRGQRRPHHRCQAAETPDGLPRQRPTSPSPRRPDRPPPPPLRGPADPHTEMISCYENLARATFTCTPTRVDAADHAGSAGCPRRGGEAPPGGDRCGWCGAHACRTRACAAADHHGGPRRDLPDRLSLMRR